MAPLGVIARLSADQGDPARAPRELFELLDPGLYGWHQMFTGPLHASNPKFK